jgi:hypothetical protein
MLKKPLVIHPYLFAIFPIFFLFAHNMGELSLNVIFIPIAITVCFTLLSCTLLSFVLKDKEKAGLVVSLFLLLFFSYEYVFGIIWLIIEVITHRHVLLVWGTVFTLGAYLTIKTRRKLHHLTILLNLVAIFAVAIPIFRIGAFEAYYGLTFRHNISKERQINTPDLAKSVKCPDIYYIILDGYARGDILEDVYQYDNSKFLGYLAQKGFYVGNRSRANYAQTWLSLASSLNLVYLDDLVDRVGEESDNRRPLIEMVNHNSVYNFLKQYGYVFVTFSSRGSSEIKNVDIHMIPGPSLSEFQSVLINTTPLQILLDKLAKKSQYDSHRDRLLYIFDHLADMTEMNSPVFVFAHILAPHPPFVFGENGESIEPNRGFSLSDGSLFLAKGGKRDEYIEDYKAQLTFVNKKIKEIIDRIISTSPEPPIIILQSDHGPGSMWDCENPDNTDFKERLSILNAYYLPDNGHKHLCNEITPVNTFRIIFNHYFGADYELLKDASYLSSWSRPYKFINASDKIESDIYTHHPE